MTTQQPSGVRPSWVDDELFPFESRFAELDGHVVHYIDEGSGPTLLMLHGNPTWSFAACTRPSSGPTRSNAASWPTHGRGR